MNAKRNTAPVDQASGISTIPPELVALDVVRSKLARTWFIGCGSIFLILLVQSFGSVYRDQLTEVWSWAMPTMLPTLSLIVSVLGADAIIASESGGKKNLQQFYVRRTFYSLVFWLSVINILLLLVTILAQPVFILFHSPDNIPPGDVLEGMNQGEEASSGLLRPADALRISNLWLTPFQSIVIASMGVLFFTKRAAS